MTEEKTASARRFVGEVAAQAGYAIREPRLRHMEWERLNGIDPEHDWAKAEE